MDYVVFVSNFSLKFKEMRCMYIFVYTIFRKLLASTFSCGMAGMKCLFLRLFILPIAMASMWLFYTTVGVSTKYLL